MLSEKNELAVLRVPAGKHLSSHRYKSTALISLSSGISSSLAAVVCSTLAVALARISSLITYRFLAVSSQYNNLWLSPSDHCTTCLQNHHSIAS